MPLNLFDAHYRSFAKLVVPELVKRCIGDARHEEHGERNSAEIEDGNAD